MKDGTIDFIDLETRGEGEVIVKLLCSSDLHGRRDWYEHLLRSATDHDAIVLAGDLLDMDSDPLLQVAYLRQWIGKVHRAGKKILLCDGNHDSLVGTSWPTNQPPSAWSDFCARAQIGEHWTEALLEEGASVVGGMTEVIAGNLIVTSLRYASDESSAISLLERGASLRRAQRLPWILLHHEPPPGLLGHPDLASRALGQWIHEYSPTAVFAGHDHQSPLRNGTCFERIGLSRVFNVGHNASAKRPLAVAFDSASLRFSWTR